MDGIWKEDESIWSCSYTYYNFLLVLVYLGMAISCIVQFIRVSLKVGWVSDKRKPQKVFLGFVAVQSIGRVAYFIMAELMIGCDQDTFPSHKPILTIVGTLPAAFFVTAFSALVLAFVRSYHIILKGATAPENRKYWIVFSVIVIDNLVMYCSFFVAFISHSYVKPHVSRHLFLAAIWVNIASTFFVGIIFTLYGIALYRGYKSLMAIHQPLLSETHRSSGGFDPIDAMYDKQSVYQAEWQRGRDYRDKQTEDLIKSGLPPSSLPYISNQLLNTPPPNSFYGNSYTEGYLPTHVVSPYSRLPQPVYTLHNTTTHSPGLNSLGQIEKRRTEESNSEDLSVDPMRKILRAAILIACCFIVRSFLISFVAGNVRMSLQLHGAITLTYFIFSEMFPVILMLRILDLGGSKPLQ